MPLLFVGCGTTIVWLHLLHLAFLPIAVTGLLLLPAAWTWKADEVLLFIPLTFQISVLAPYNATAP